MLLAEEDIIFLHAQGHVELTERELVMIRWKVDLSREALMMLRKGGSIPFFSEKELETTILPSDLKELSDAWVELTPAELIIMYDSYESEKDAEANIADHVWQELFYAFELNDDMVWDIILDHIDPDEAADYRKRRSPKMLLKRTSSSEFQDSLADLMLEFGHEYTVEEVKKAVLKFNNNVEECKAWLGDGDTGYKATWKRHREAFYNLVSKLVHSFKAKIHVKRDNIIVDSKNELHKELGWPDRGHVDNWRGDLEIKYIGEAGETTNSNQNKTRCSVRKLNMSF